MGFELWRLPPLTKTIVPFFDGHAPLLYHGSSRSRPCRSRVVALSFFQLFHRRTGQPKFRSRQDLATHFQIASDAVLIASATEEDPPLERWWQLASKDLVYENLKQLGVALVTSPNYSVFNNVPYWDNDHNLKRIAFSWVELMQAGIPCALHINAHRQRDYDNWKELIQVRKDITALSVEFGTGMGHPSRAPWHIEQLCDLARSAGRPLSLVVRGGLAYAAQLRRGFASLLFIDTDPFLRTLQRSRAVLGNDFSILWRHEPTEANELLDDRLDEAIAACAKNFEEAASGSKVSRKSLRLPTHANNETGNIQNLTQLSFSLTIGVTQPAKNVVSASEPQQATQVI